MTQATVTQPRHRAFLPLTPAHARAAHAQAANALPAADSSPQADPREAFARKMADAGLNVRLVSLFLDYYEDIRGNRSGLIPESDILPVGRDDFAELADLAPYAAAGRKLLARAVTIRLNGGLGTSMGMTHAKSLLPAKDGKTFLQIIHQQTEHQREPGAPSALLLMNSFATHTDTQRELLRIAPREAMPALFMQHRFPKVGRTTLRPVSRPDYPQQEWNPPGHGDIYAALVLSGTLEGLLRQGRRYALIANADNLGATIDPAILGYMAEEEIPFIMECAPRTASDRKGGHLARSRSGGLLLRELAQCPEADLPRFQDIARYGLFNTNNIWIDLHALRNHVEQHGLLHLPMMLNPKTADPRDKHSEPVWQIETAMGAAIALFPGARAIVTTRERFLPVKKCSDLLALRSDCFILHADGRVLPNDARSGVAGCSTDIPPVVDLDPNHYGTWDRLDARFPHGAPSLLGCTSLTVRGDVLFGRNVTVRGAVHITNPSVMQARIPDNAILEEDIHLQP